MGWLIFLTVSFLFLNNCSYAEHIKCKLQKSCSFLGSCEWPFVVGESLNVGEYYCESRNVVFGLDSTGNLVLLDVSSSEYGPIWSAGTQGPNVQARFEPDGNLVVYDSSDPNATVLWQSNTKGGKKVAVKIATSGNIQDSFAYIETSGSGDEYAFITGKSSVKHLWRSNSDGGGVYGGGRCIYSDSYSSKLLIGGILGVRDFVCASPDLIFGLDETGDLALLDVSSSVPTKIWSAGTSGENVVAELTSDGNLVVSDSSNTSAGSVLWESATRGGASLGVHVNKDVLTDSYAFISDSTDEDPYAFVTGKSSVKYLWRSNSYGGGVYGGGRCTFSSTEKMKRGTVMKQNEYWCASPDVIFGMDGTGDLALFDVSQSTRKKIWSAGTSGDETYATLNDYGNLVVYSGTATDKKVLWTTDIHGGSEVGVKLGDAIDDSFAFVSGGRYSGKLYWRSNSMGGGVYGGGYCKFSGKGFERGNTLRKHEYFCASSNLIFGIDGTGDLALIDVRTPVRKKLWSAGTTGDTAYAELDTTGNLLVYSSTEQDTKNVLWRTNIRDGFQVGVKEADDFLKSYAFITDSEYSIIGHRYWRSNSNGGGVYAGGLCKFDSEEMALGDFIETGDYVCGDGNTIIGFDEKGDFALIDVSKPIFVNIWCAGVEGAGRMELHADGSINVYHRETGSLLWNSATAYNAEYLGIEVQDILPQSFFWMGKQCCPIVVTETTIPFVVYDTEKVWTANQITNQCSGLSGGEKGSATNVTENDSNETSGGDTPDQALQSNYPSSGTSSTAIFDQKNNDGDENFGYDSDETEANSAVQAFENNDESSGTPATTFFKGTLLLPMLGVLVISY